MLKHERIRELLQYSLLLNGAALLREQLGNDKNEEMTMKKAESLQKANPSVISSRGRPINQADFWYSDTMNMGSCLHSQGCLKKYIYRLNVCKC